MSLPLGQTAWQITDSAGLPVTGAKLYFYEAGTLAAKAVYTTASLSVAHPNPVIADAAGKAVIWLGAGAYRVRVETSGGVHLPAYDADNLEAPTGAGVSGGGSYSALRETKVAIDGQTVFTLSNTYVPGSNSIAVFVDGLILRQSDYSETSSSIVTLSSPMSAGREVDFIIGRFVSGGIDGASISTSTAGGSEARTLQDRAGDGRNILDYGGDPSGTTDSSAAALLYKTWLEGNVIAVVPEGTEPMRFPPGFYELSAQTFSKATKIKGAGSKQTFIRLKAGETAPLFTFNAADTALTSTDDTDHSSVEGVRLLGNRVDGTTTGASHGISCPDAGFLLTTQYAPSVRVSDVVIEGFTGSGIFLGVNRNWALIDRVIARYCNDNGLSSYSYDHRIVSSDFGVNKNIGVRLFAGGGVVMTGCNVYFNDQNIVVNNTVNAYVNLIGCASDGAFKEGLAVAGATGVVRMIGGRFTGNSRAGANLYSDILVAGAACIVGIDDVDFTLGDQAVKLLLETSGAPAIMWVDNEYQTSGSVPYATGVTNDFTLLRYAGTRDARIGSSGIGTLSAYTSGIERWKTADANTTFNHPVRLMSYTVAGLPAPASHASGIVYVSNESGGAVIAFSDGTNWRRATDRAVVS